MSQYVGSVGSSLRRRVVGECRCGETPVIHTVTDNTNLNCGKKKFGDAKITGIIMRKVVDFLS